MESSLPLPIRGLVIGFTIAAAVGPISLLTIRRTLSHGQLYGLVSGLGVATADATYAGIAAFGLTAVTGTLVSGRVALGIVGGVIIAVLGVRTILSEPGEVARDAARPGLAAAFASIYALTMTNPMTIVSFAAVFAGIGLVAGLVLRGCRRADAGRVGRLRPVVGRADVDRELGTGARVDAGPSAGSTGSPGPRWSRSAPWPLPWRCAEARAAPAPEEILRSTLPASCPMAAAARGPNRAWRAFHPCEGAWFIRSAKRIWP